jgi:hypothetical protein
MAKTEPQENPPRRKRLKVTLVKSTIGFDKKQATWCRASG